MTELVIGTAQFGTGYGVTNAVKRIDDDTVGGIIATAIAEGVRTFDTADGYGDAQERVGRLAPAEPAVHYVSKFALDGPPTPESLYGGAMARLRTDTLHGLLLHRISDLVDNRFPEALRLIREAKSAGEISQFGVSIYDKDDLDLALRVMPDLGLIQMPGSVVDRRLLDSPLVREIRERGVSVHVRSAFLQGLLLAPTEELPGRFEGLGRVHLELDTLAAERSSSRLQILLGVLALHENVDSVVVGATSVRELKDIVEAWGSLGTGDYGVRFDDLPLEIIDPRRWEQG